jgi:4'-phosphopantetheinyl transferase
VDHARVIVRRTADVLHSAAEAPDWLTPGERTRAAILRAPSRHAQYLAGHWLLRQLLADAFGGDARDYALIERDNLPPALDGSTLRLSLTHGGDWVAAACSTAPIGIDLEPRQPRPALGRLQHLLLNAEEPPDSLDNDALLQRWVLKEALIKRDCGNALPQQLAALSLRPTGADIPAVELVSSAHWHLAMAPPVARVDLDVAVQARSCWASALGECRSG